MRGTRYLVIKWTNSCASTYILRGPSLQEAASLKVPTVDGKMEDFLKEVFKAWKRQFDRKAPFPYFEGYGTHTAKNEPTSKWR